MVPVPTKIQPTDEWTWGCSSLRGSAGPEFIVFERLEPRFVFSSVFGPELLLNQTTINGQSGTAAGAVAASTGGIISVWESYNQDSPLTWGIEGRRFDVDGNAVGGEFLVNAGYILSDQRRPRVAMNDAGAFVVVWEGRGLLGLFPGIYAQRYDAAGNTVGGAIGVAGSAVLSVANAAVGLDTSGTFVVAYESTDALLSTGIFARRYAADGTPFGAEFRVNVTTAGQQVAPVVAMAPNGSFAIGWEGPGAGDGSGGVYARTYDSSGNAITGEVLVNTTTGGSQGQAAIAPMPLGGFGVVWSGNGAGDGSGVFMRRLDASGAALASELLLNATTAGTQQRPAIAFDVDGDAMVTWSGQGAGDADGVFAREYDAAGVARGTEFLINATTAGTQNTPSITSRGDNQYFVAWNGNGTGDSDGVFARLLKNDPPVVTTAGTTLAYTEDAGPIPVDAAISVSDVDDTTLAGATVSIGTNYMLGEDVLGFVDQAGIVGSWNALTGVLTLSGNASRAIYQTALRSVTYENLSENPSALPRSLLFAVDDGKDVSVPASRTVSVSAVNDAPVITTSGSTLSYTENAGAIAIDSGLAVTDVDNSTLSGATLSIAANYVNGEDVLGFVNQAGIVGSWNAATGVLTLTGVASLAAYQTALRSITYTNTSDNPSTAIRTVTFLISDGAASSSPANRAVSVLAVNDPPSVVATSTTLTYVENVAATAIDTGLTIADVDSLTLAGATIAITGNYATGEDILSFPSQSGITGTWNAATGVLTLVGTASLVAYQAALRSVTYMNSSDNPSTSARTIAFQVNDGVASSSAAHKTIAVIAINDAPSVTTTASTLLYTENAGSVGLDAGVTLFDPDNVTLAGATLSIVGGFAIGEDVLGFVAQAGITGTWNAATGTLTLSGVASIPAYQAALRSVTYTNTSDNPSVVTRTISMVVDDGQDVSVPASRTVSVSAVNDAPVITTSGSTLSYTENAGALAVDPGLSVMDVDNATLVGATITIGAGYVNGQDVLGFVNQAGITGAWNAGTGVLTLTGTASLSVYETVLRSVTYANTSDNPITSARLVVFQVSDGTDLSATASRVISVLAVNDPPVVTCSATVLAYVEDAGAVIIDGNVTVADVDDSMLGGATISITTNYVIGEDRLAFVNQSGISGFWNATTGVLTLTGIASLAAYQTALRSVTYTNLSDDPSGAARTVSFVVSDNQDMSAAAARVVSVLSVNDPPVVVTTGTALSYLENAGAIVIDAGLTVTDPDNAQLAGATIRISANYSAGEDVLGFVDQSGIIGTWNPITGTLTLAGAASVAAYQAALRSVTYTNSSDSPSLATRTVSIVVDDGTDLSASATRAIIVTAVDDAPTVSTSGSSLVYVENIGALPIDAGLIVNDVDSTTLAGATVSITGNYVFGEDMLRFIDQFGITGSWNAAAGILILTGVATVADYQAALRSVTYVDMSEDPSPFVRTVTFWASDGSATSAPAIRLVSVVAVNDPPIVDVAAGHLLYIENSVPTQVDPALVIVDVDSGTLAGVTVTISGNYAMGEDVLAFTGTGTIVGSWDAVTGTLTLSGTATLAAYQAALRSVTYVNMSDNPSTATRTISFVANDGLNTGPGAARLVDVLAVNDAPMVTMDANPLGYVENDPPTAIDPTLLAIDVDSLVLFGATVRISGNYAAGEDILSFVNQGGITATWDAVTGVLTLAGATSPAAYRSALRSVTYTNTSDNPSSAWRTLSVVVNDGTDSSAPATRQISVTPTNDPPTITTTASIFPYIENSGAAVLDVGVTVDDVDSATLSGATIRISGNFAPGEDVLGFVSQGGIAGSWNAATGVLTLSGVASLASYQAALRSVTYANISEAPSTLARSISFAVSDGLAQSNLAMRMVDVSAVDDPPIVTTTSSALAYFENSGPVALDAGISVSDLDDATLVGATVSFVGTYRTGEDVLVFSAQSGITGSWNAVTGVLTLAGSASVSAYQAALRSIRYVNTSEDPDLTTRVLSFVVDDGVAASATAHRDITIAGINDPPVVVLSTLPLTYVENSGAATIDSLLAIWDVDSGSLVWATVSLSSGYVPGEDVLGFLNQAGIVGSWNAASGVLTLSGSARVAAYQTALRSVTYANASDAPTTMSRTVQIVVSDGQDASVPETRVLSVFAVNDPPTITTTPAPLAYLENTPPIRLDSGVDVRDVDSAVLVSATITIVGNYVIGQDVLSFANQSGIVGSWNAASGILTLSGASSIAAYRTALRSIEYVNMSEDPSVALRSVSFQVSDGTSQSVPALRSIHVTAVNDPPVVALSGGPLSYTEGSGALALDGGIALIDPDNTTLAGATVAVTSNYLRVEDVLSFTGFGGIVGNWNAVSGVLTLSGIAPLATYQAAMRLITYTNTSHSPSQLTRAVSVRVSDGLASSATVIKEVEVLAVIDGPIVQMNVGTLTYPENSGPVQVDPTLWVADSDSPSLAAAMVALTGNYRAGEDVLAFTDRLGIHGSWNPATGILTLTGRATVSAYQAALRSVTYENTSDDPSGVARTVSVAVSDGLLASIPATRNIAVEPQNDGPHVACSSGPLVYSENAGAVLLDAGCTVSDVDSPLLSAAIVAITGNYVPGEDSLIFANQWGIVGAWNSSTGMLQLSGSASVAAWQTALRSISYVNSSDNPSAATRTVSIIVSDGLAFSEVATRAIQVLAVNDAPVVNSSGGSAVFVEKGAMVAVDPGIVVFDSDDVTLGGATVAITTNYSRGQDALVFVDQAGITGHWDAETGVLTLAGFASIAAYQTALRSVTFANTSDNPLTGARTVTFSVSDAAAESAQTYKAISVHAVDDAPVAFAGRTMFRYALGDGSVVIDPNAAMLDVDSAVVLLAEVRIAQGYVPGQDVLEASAGSDITVMFDAATGTLRLSGPVNWNDMNAAVRSVRFSTGFVGDGERTFEYRVYDGLWNAQPPSIAATVRIPPVDEIVGDSNSGGASSHTGGGSDGIGHDGSDAGEVGSGQDGGGSVQPRDILTSDPGEPPTTSDVPPPPRVSPRVRPEQVAPADLPETPPQNRGRESTLPTTPPASRESADRPEAPSRRLPAVPVRPAPSLAPKAIVPRTVSERPAVDDAAKVAATAEVQIIVRARPAHEGTTPTAQPGDERTRTIVITSAQIGGAFAGAYGVWMLGGVLAARRSARVIEEVWSADLVLLIRAWEDQQASRSAAA